MSIDKSSFPSRPQKFWTRQKINFGFGIQTFSKSYFGSATSHGTRYGFGGFEFGRTRFGTAGDNRGPTSSFAKIDNYWGHTGRLSGKCIAARGELAGEEWYWYKHMDERTGCRPRPTKILGHYKTLRKAKINSITAYIYHRWKIMSDEDKEIYQKKVQGKSITGINKYIKDFFAKWGFGKCEFAKGKFGSFHYALCFFGFSTVAFGMGAFGSNYPEPRRLGFGIQSFGEMRFGSNLRSKRELRKYR